VKEWAPLDDVAGQRGEPVESDGWSMERCGATVWWNGVALRFPWAGRMRVCLDCPRTMALIQLFQWFG